MKKTTNMSASEIRLLVFASVLSVALCEFKLVILHTNDMHSRFEETNAHSGECVPKRGPCYGGFARLKEVVQEYRGKAKADGYNSVFLNAGDTYQGTVFYTLFKWKIVSEMINTLGIDAMSLGNHEFDDGPAGLAPFLENTTVPVVSANIDYSKEPALASSQKVAQKLTRSTVLTVAGVKIGVIGYLTPDTKFLSSTGKVIFEDEITAIKQEAAKLKKEGIKILIAVGHSGYTKDQEIAEKVPDLDIVVGGHTNTFLYNGKAPDIDKVEGPYPTVVKQSSGRKVYVVQAYAYTKYLGYLQVTFNDDGEVTSCGGQPILIKSSFKKDKGEEEIVVRYEHQVGEKAGRKIGSSRTFLEADEKTCRVRECNFANLVTDAIVYANAKDYNGKGWTDAPVGLVQGGSFRSSIDTELREGSITFSNLLTTLPFQNSVEKLNITGDILHQLLEHSVKNYSLVDKPGAFMQFSGVHVEYDLSKASGSRVVSASVRCGDCDVPQYFPLDTAKKYRVVTTSYLADGGDGYDMLKKASSRTVLSFTDVDAVENYLQKRSPVYPEIEGRIHIKGSAALSASPGVITSLLCLAALKIFTNTNID